MCVCMPACVRVCVSIETNHYFEVYHNSGIFLTFSNHANIEDNSHFKSGFFMQPSIQCTFLSETLLISLTTMKHGYKKCEKSDFF